jgi:hypothetical protein
MHRIRDKAPQAPIIIGDDRAGLRASIRELKLEGTVGLRPHAARKIADMMARWTSAWSQARRRFRNEAFSTKIMEFMAMGAGAASETQIDRYYFNDNLVQFFRSADPEDLAAKILTRWATRRAANLREKGRRFIAQTLGM